MITKTNPTFWNTLTGIVSKAVINLFLSSLMLFCIFYFLHQQITSMPQLSIGVCFLICAFIDIIFGFKLKNIEGDILYMRNLMAAYYLIELSKIQSNKSQTSHTVDNSTEKCENKD